MDIKETCKNKEYIDFVNEIQISKIYKNKTLASMAVSVLSLCEIIFAIMLNLSMTMYCFLSIIIILNILWEYYVLKNGIYIYLSIAISGTTWFILLYICLFYIFQIVFYVNRHLILFFIYISILVSVVSTIYYIKRMQAWILGSGFKKKYKYYKYKNTVTYGILGGCAAIFLSKDLFLTKLSGILIIITILFNIPNYIRQLIENYSRFFILKYFKVEKTGYIF